MAAAVPFVLVACVSSKISSAAPAAELYRSDWFAKARAYAERRGGGWAILSALHGLVEPGAMLEPYDACMKGKTPLQRRAWADRVTDELNRLAFGRSIEILAGEDYRKPLRDWPRFRSCFPDVAAPMEGLGIGYQKQWLGRQLRAPEQLALAI